MKKMKISKTTGSGSICSIFPDYGCLYGNLKNRGIHSCAESDDRKCAGGKVKRSHTR